ncbi:MAG: hypothetical protein ABGX23_06165 [Nautiliaceae bacterium]
MKLIIGILITLLFIGCSKPSKNPFPDTNIQKQNAQSEWEKL